MSIVATFRSWRSRFGVVLTLKGIESAVHACMVSLFRDGWLDDQFEISNKKSNDD
jgi:hypothetical protein